MAKKVKETSWNGLPKFDCPYCQYDNLLDRGPVEEHMVQAHADQIRLDNLIKEARAEGEDEEETSEETPESAVAATAAGKKEK